MNGVNVGMINIQQLLDNPRVNCSIEVNILQEIENTSIVVITTSGLYRSCFFISSPAFNCLCFIYIFL